MKTLAVLLLIVGYIGLYQIINGKTHLIPIVLIAFGMAIVLGLQVTVTEFKKKN